MQLIALYPNLYFCSAYIQAGDKAEKEKAVDIKGGTETILIADDEPVVTKYAKRLLTNIGYTVFTASDGMEALKIYKKQKESIDIVILDLMMPVMSGEKAFEELLKINPKVKVIVSSGFSEDAAIKGILKKANGFLSKPYKFEEAARLIRKVLDS